ncbi:MAG: hypothetical protein Ct9H300mP11_15630 [Chloroflexota bacterium]|nr:MAG: hypothetical protein Ct9H300mP11_15630 [Chloroflexota bacterium]
MRVTYRLATRLWRQLPPRLLGLNALVMTPCLAMRPPTIRFYRWLLGATSTTRAVLETRVAIAFPRSPMINPISGARFERPI